ncbi:hypothetical protein SPRG_06492, partial [Saprolegnia parasitica CBS 223.65]
LCQRPLVAGYNVTGHEAFLIDLVNGHLATTTTAASTLNVLAPSATVQASYAAPVSFTAVFPTYARRAIMTELTSIAYAVPQLRTLSASWSMRMNVQHCYVDFGQFFEVAHSRQRQARCKKWHATNAAVYMEATLRNVVWADFVEIWGGDNGPFTKSIQQPLLESARGAAFLGSLASARHSTSIEDEIHYWHRVGMRHFQLQWQNLWQPGISETIFVQNALGMQQVVTLKNVPRTNGPWTSLNFFWMPLNDIWTGYDANRSMVRDTSTYFGANVSASMPAINLEVLNGNIDISGGFAGPAFLVRSSIGPFLSIDCLYQGVPPALAQLYMTYQSSLFEQLLNNASAMALFSASASIQLSPVPPTWTSASVFYGGNPMCTAQPPTSFVQQSFDFFDDCSTPVALEIPLYPTSALLARTVMPPEFTAAGVCALTTTRAECLKGLASTSQLLDHLATPHQVAALMANVTIVIHAMNLSLMQFATTADGSWTLLQQPLLDKSHFSFFGWLLLLDWVVGAREVVSFQGDAGTVTLISNAYSPQLYQTGAQPLETATKIVLYLVVLTSVVLAVVGVVVLLLAGHVRLRFVGRNLFYFNRIVGGVWIGRPLLFLRGCTAVLLLSSTNITLRTAHGYVRLVQTPRPWFASVVTCGETTWLTYVVSEVLLLATHGGPRWLDAMASGISWLALLWIEAIMPVQVTTSFGRSCFGQDMDYAVACTSGTIAIGSFERVGLILGVQILVVLSSSLVLGYLASVRKPARASIQASLLLSSIAHAYVQSIESSPDDCTIDLVACLLSGLLPLRFRGISYTLDMKLWVLLQDNASSASLLKTLPRPALDFRSHRPRRASTLSQILNAPLVRSSGNKAMWLRHLRMVIGVCYIGASITSSLSYLKVSRVNLANDLFWASFNVTGHHAFFANWLNEQLVLGKTSMPHLLLDEPSLVSTHSFAAPTAVVKSSASYGAYLQHEPLSELAAVIQGLRQTDGCNAPWIFVPYCYLDFDQRWQVANSAKRQIRCADMAHNGAVYLESVLRNIDLGAFNACWGNAFQMGIADELLASNAGTAWLHATVSATQVAIASEVALWRQHGIRHYKVQWQNYKLLGVFNRYSIANAYGVKYPMTLTAQNGTSRIESQTSFKMYWAFANDLHALTSNTTTMGGRSLLRSSTRFAFANTSLESIYMQNGTLPSPLPASLRLVQSLLGPFGAIDMIYVAVPTALRDLVASLIELSRLPLAHNLTAQAMYMNITPLDDSFPVPGRWLAQDLVSYGGSPLCESLAYGYAVSVGLMGLPSFQGSCVFASGSMTKFQPTRQQYIVSALLARLHESPFEDDFSNVCAHEPTFPTKCQHYLRQTLWYIRSVMLPLPSATLLSMQSATAEATERNISLMIYTHTEATAPLSIQTLHLLDKTESDFHFFAWLFLYDWVLGSREVISFVGDLGQMTLLSDHRPPLAQETQAWQVTANTAQYLRAGVTYVTCVMLAVAILLTIYILLSRGHCEGFNMLELGRVGGVVWVGRPLLVLRSMTAVCVLSSATLELQHSGYMTSFATLQDPWYKTLLAANEVTWLVSILNDVCLVWTRELSAYYVVLNVLVVVLVVAVLTALAPVRATANIDLQCVVAHVDWHVLCDAGGITIGDVSRLQVLIGIVFLCNVLCFYAVKLSVNTAPSHVTSLFLSSGAKYLYRHDGRVFNGAYYLDRASAALVGLLSVRIGSRMYSLDIKSWRTFVLDVPQSEVPSTHGMAAAFNAAYPLLD